MKTIKIYKPKTKAMLQALKKAQMIASRKKVVSHTKHRIFMIDDSEQSDVHSIKVTGVSNFLGIQAAKRTTTA